MSVNILSLHQNIITRLDKDEETKKEAIIFLNSLLQAKTYTKEFLENILSIKTSIEEDMTNEIFKAQTLLIIVEYSQILKNPISHQEELVTPILKRKHELTNTYSSLCRSLIHAKKWYDITINTSGYFQNSNSACLNCGNDDEENFEYDEYNRRNCLSCFSQFSNIETGLTPRDYNRINTLSKFNYNRILHFQDCIKQYQGKQNCRVPEKVYQDLEQKFKGYRVLIESSNPQIRYSKVTRNHILVFLKELKHIKHYENVNLIYYTLTNKRFDDITYLEDQLMDDFKKLIVLYDSLHGKDRPAELDRKNFMNVQYLLFQLLKRHGHKCKIEDFTIVKTIDRKLFHDNICKNLFDILNWNFTPTF
jgi:hypothetical protein